MSEEEWKSKSNDVFILAEDINSEAELRDFAVE